MSDTQPHRTNRKNFLHCSRCELILHNCVTWRFHFISSNELFWDFGLFASNFGKNVRMLWSVLCVDEWINNLLGDEEQFLGREIEIFTKLSFYGSRNHRKNSTFISTQSWFDFLWFQLQQVSAITHSNNHKNPAGGGRTQMISFRGVWN